MLDDPPDLDPNLDPRHQYFLLLKHAADLYATDNRASRGAAVAATIDYLRSLGVDAALIQPFIAVFGSLADESEDVVRKKD